MTKPEQLILAIDSPEIVMPLQQLHETIRDLPQCLSGGLLVNIGLHHDTDTTLSELFIENWVPSPITNRVNRVKAPFLTLVLTKTKIINKDHEQIKVKESKDFLLNAHFDTGQEARYDTDTDISPFCISVSSLKVTRETDTEETVSEKSSSRTVEINDPSLIRQHVGYASLKLKQFLELGD